MGKVNSENYKFKLRILSLLILAILICGGIFLYKNFLTNKILYEADKKKADKCINVLLVGLDIGDPTQKNNEKIKRTDTIMLVKFNPKTKKAIIVSIPRDILVVVNGKNQKINNVMALKGENGLRKQIESMLYQHIDYMVKVNYTGFRKMMDAIGGVNVDIDTDMKYDDITQNLHIDLKKGKNVHLNGQQCEHYFRWRKNNDGSGLSDGDLGRINNQHKFIEAVIAKCKSPSIILKIPGILKALPETIESDMSRDEMIGYGLNLLDLKSSSVKMVTLKGTPVNISKISYLKYNENSNREILDLISGDAPAEVADVKRENLKIEVLNGTSVNGLAASAAKKLKEDGYKNIKIGNSRSKCSESVIKLKNDKLKFIVANDTGIAKIKNVEANDIGEYDAIIVLGKDYKK